VALELQKGTNIRPLWGTAQLFKHPRYMHGAATSERGRKTPRLCVCRPPPRSFHALGAARPRRRGRRPRGVGLRMSRSLLFGGGGGRAALLQWGGGRVGLRRRGEGAGRPWALVVRAGGGGEKQDEGSLPWPRVEDGLVASDPGPQPGATGPAPLSRHTPSEPTLMSLAGATQLCGRALARFPSQPLATLLPPDAHHTHPKRPWNPHAQQRAPHHTSLKPRRPGRQRVFSCGGPHAPSSPAPAPRARARARRHAQARTPACLPMRRLRSRRLWT
jgi:hypothetical protein